MPTAWAILSRVSSAVVENWRNERNGWELLKANWLWKEEKWQNRQRESEFEKGVGWNLSGNRGREWPRGLKEENSRTKHQIGRSDLIAKGEEKASWEPRRRRCEHLDRNKRLFHVYWNRSQSLLYLDPTVTLLIKPEFVVPIATSVNTFSSSKRKEEKFRSAQRTGNA